MTTEEKTTIHELLSAYRIGPAINQLRRHLPPGQTELWQKLATLEGRLEHFTHAGRADYTPTERRHENDELVKQLQVMLSRITVNDKPRTLADVIGRELDEDFREREFNAAPEPTPPPVGEKGFFGTVNHAGSSSAKRATIRVGKSYGATYHACTQAMRAQLVEITNGDRDGGMLTGCTNGKMSARYGEAVLIWVKPLPKGQCEVTVVVDSHNGQAVFDMGRHQRLLDQLTHKIQYA